MAHVEEGAVVMVYVLYQVNVALNGDGVEQVKIIVTIMVEEAEQVVEVDQERVVMATVATEGALTHPSAALNGDGVERLGIIATNKIEEHFIRVTKQLK